MSKYEPLWKYLKDNIKKTINYLMKKLRILYDLK